MTGERAAGGSLAHRNYETKPDLPARSVTSLVWLSEIKPNFRGTTGNAPKNLPPIPEIRRQTVRPG